MKILYVEDQETFAKTVIETFLLGHEVTHVTTVRVGKDTAANAKFDVVLVDYDLPDGKGDEVVRAIRAGGSTVPIVAVSSHASGNKALEEAGANEVCAKADAPKLGPLLVSIEQRS